MTGKYNTTVDISWLWNTIFYIHIMIDIFQLMFFFSKLRKYLKTKIKEEIEVFFKTYNYIQGGKNDCNQNNIRVLCIK